MNSDYNLSSFRKKPIVKILSIILLQAFLFYNVGFATVDKTSSFAKEETQRRYASEDKAPKIQQISIDNIGITKDIGTIKDRYRGKDTEKTVIHIQDAHCNYEAQQNIARILEELIKNHNINFVAVEGADGIVDTSWFKAFPDAEIRKEVADYFMKKGEITGAEFLSITSDYPFTIYGAESRKHYIKNLNSFLESYSYKDQFQKYYKAVKAILHKLKKFIYTKELINLDRKISQHKEKELKFADYAAYLKKVAESKKINIKEYKNFNILIDTLQYEKDIDFDIVNKERAALIDELSKKLAKDELTKLVNRSIDFKLGKIETNEFYTELARLAGENKISLSKKYNNLARYIIYARIYAKIDNEKLFDELDLLVSAIKERMFVNDKQRELDRLWRNVNVVLGFMNIELTNKEYEYYLANKGEFAPEKFIDFITHNALNFGLAYDIGTAPSELSYIFPKLVDFYEIATKRDEIIVKNMFKGMRGKKTDVGVLITGGFHTKGIAKTLVNKGVSYVVISPTITKEVESPYISVLTGQKTPFEELLVETGEEKELLAPYVISQLVPLSERALTILARRITKATGRGLTDRVEAVKREWTSRIAKAWINKAKEIAKERKIEFDRDILLKSFMLAFDRRAKEIGLPAAYRKNIDELAKEEFARVIPKGETRTPGKGAIRDIAHNTPYERAEAGRINKAIAATMKTDRFRTVFERETKGVFVVLDDKAYEGFAGKYNAPLDIVCHPGTRRTRDRYDSKDFDSYGKVNRYYYIKGSIFDQLTAKERTIFAMHEEMHIKIALGIINVPEDISEEEFINKQLGCDVRSIMARLGSASHMEDLLLTDIKYGDAAKNYIESVRKEIKNLLKEGKEKEARQKEDNLGEFIKHAYIRRYNIDQMKSVFTEEPYRGYDVIIVSSTTPDEADYQRKILDQAFDGEYTENKDLNHKVCVLSILDESEGGQIIGQVNTWAKTKAAFEKWAAENKLKTADIDELFNQNKVKIAIYHNGGKGERASPATQSLGNSRGAQRLVGDVLNSKEKKIDLELILAIVLETSPLATTNDGSQIDTFWGNQLAFGTIDFSQIDRSKSYHFGKFVIGIPKNPKKKDLFDYGTAILSKTGKILKFLANKRLTKKENNKYVQNPEYESQYGELMKAVKNGRGVFDYGSFSMSRDMHYALVDYWTKYRRIFEKMRRHKDGRAGFSRDIDPALVQILVPLLNGLEGKKLPRRLPTIGALKEIGKFPKAREQLLDETYRQLIKAMDEKYTAALEKIYNKKDKKGKTDKKARQSVYESIEFFLIYKDSIFKQWDKIIGHIDLGEGSHWFAYKRLLDMGNEKFLMLSDLIGKSLELNPDGEAVKTSLGIEDKIKAEDLRRAKRITNAAIATFKVNGHKIALTAEQVRKGWSGYGVTVKGSIIQGNTVLLPGSVIINSVVNDSHGRIRVENSYLEYSTAPVIKSENSIIYNAIDKKAVEGKGEIIADAYRPRIDKDDRFPKGQTRMRAPVGYDPKPEDEEAAAKMSDKVLFGDNKYTFQQIRNFECNRTENDRIEASIREEQVNIMKERNKRAAFCRETYAPVKMGTSGLRGDANKDLTDIETYINSRAQIEYLIDLHQMDFHNMENTDGNIIAHLKKAVTRRGDYIAVAGDFRPSTPRLLVALAYAIKKSGCRVDFQGLTPTPEIANYGINGKNIASMMVTGSHNPFKDNGIKTYRANGELLKIEEPILKKYIEKIRNEEYMQTWDETIFDKKGKFKTMHKIKDKNNREILQEAIRFKKVAEKIKKIMQGDKALKKVETEADKLYYDRFVDFFGANNSLKGKDIIIYQHSSVGTSYIIPKILKALGANVILKKKTKDFVSVDTENLIESTREVLRGLVVEHKNKTGKKPFAVISTDGDADRPVCCDENGEFLYGDKLGVITSLYLGVDFIAAPVSANEKAVKKVLREKYKRKVVETKIGSPHVIAAALRETALEKKGSFEVNGGYILCSDIKLDNGKVLKKLATRDALLPILCTMLKAINEDKTISQLIEDVFKDYESYSHAGLVQNTTSKITPGCKEYTREIGPAIIEDFKKLSKEDTEKKLKVYLKEIRGLEKINVTKINYMDGMRIYLTNDEIVHFRPSGNAAQFRIYAEADTQKRAEQIVKEATGANTGMLVKIIQDFVEAQKTEEKTTPQTTRTPGTGAVRTGEAKRPEAVLLKAKIEAQKALLPYIMEALGLKEGEISIVEKTGKFKFTDKKIQEAYYDRGTHDAAYMYERGLIPDEMIEDKEAFFAAKHDVVYNMFHLLRDMKGAKDELHLATHFPGKAAYEGTNAYKTTGSHFQGRSMDVKYAREGFGLQLLAYRANDNVWHVDLIPLYPGAVAVSLPGTIDVVINLGGLNFTDRSFKVNDEVAEEIRKKLELHPKFAEALLKDNVKFADELPAKGAPIVVFEKDGKVTISAHTAYSEHAGRNMLKVYMPDRIIPHFSYAFNGIREVPFSEKAEEIFAPFSNNYVKQYKNALEGERGNFTVGAAGQITGFDVEIGALITAEESGLTTLAKIDISRYLPMLMIYKNIKEGKPIEFYPEFRTGKDNYIWGEDVKKSFILELMGAETEAEKIALAEKYGINAKDVVSERWITAGAIKVGREYTHFPGALALLGKEVFGIQHFAQFGPESGITAKILTSARPLSMQIHEFPEMIIPLEDGYAYMGLSRNVTQEEFISALEKGDESIFNKIEVKKDQPLIVPAGMPHAYGVVKVYEIKGVNAAKDKAGTISFYDRLRLDKKQKQLVLQILKEAKSPQKAVDKLVEEELVRDKKDVLTLPDERVEEIARRIDGYGYLKKADLKTIKVTPTLASDTTEEGAQFEIMGKTDKFIAGRYTINSGKSIKCNKLLEGRAHSIFVTKGKVEIINEQDKGIDQVIKGGERMIPVTTGKYKLKSIGEEQAIIYTQVKPLEQAGVKGRTERIDNAKEIFEKSTEPNSKALGRFLKYLSLSGTLDKRAVIVAYDTGLEEDISTGHVAQAGERPINRYLDGKLINVRSTGEKLLDHVNQARNELARAGIPYVVVTIAGNETVSRVGEDLGKISKILNIQNPDGRYIPIIGLYELALRIAYESDIKSILSCLNRIGFNPNNTNFTQADVEELLINGIIRILPRIVIIDMGERIKAYKGSQRVLMSL